MKKRYLTTLMMSFLVVGMLSGCGHTHTWTEATCTQPKTCSECGETEGEALGHTWIEATCTQPKTCSECGETEGEALGHTWIEATCMAPKTCSECGQTEGTSLEHRLNHNTGKCYECEEQIATMIDRYEINDFFNSSHTSLTWSPCTFSIEPKKNGYSYAGDITYNISIVDKFTGKVESVSAVYVELDENGYGSGSIEFNDGYYRIEFEFPQSYVCYY